MEENSNSLPFKFGKLSLKKGKQEGYEQDTPSPKLEDLTEESNIVQIKKVVSKQNSVSSQLPLFEEIKEPTNPTKSFVQRRQNLDEELKRELKMLKKNIAEPKPTEDGKIRIYLKTQRRYSTEVKTKVVELAEKIGPYQVSVQTGIPEASVRRWKKNGPVGKGGSGRQPLFPNVESELMKMFRDSRSLGILMTNSCLLNEARKIGERLKVKDFVGTLSWLEGVKKRNGICYRRSTRVSQRIPEDAKVQVEEFREKFLNLYTQHQYPLNAIVNIDETGINFDSISNYTLEFKVSSFSFKLS